eukprot:TRINITY_DN20358_c0_g1_i1.p1 TRINITY_DN20358_c0_g1~~TRINITY_DN20358_c0_g1_i1.p1  ORF type:complete len:804 (+),score=144.29 TRINITY_DN20358_c0_g1_i1:68-2413(+)
MLIQPLRFSADVNKALAEALPSDCPFDDPEFDPMVFVNEMFPDEASLSRLDAYVDQLDAEIDDTSSHLKATVREQAVSNTQAETNLVEAQNSIQDLFKKVDEIRRMAEESELMVMEICTEISSLDNAKKNLFESITTLKKIREVTERIEELRQTIDAEPPDLSVASDCIQQSADIMRTYFSGHEHVQRIKELGDNLAREKALCAKQATQILLDIDVMSIEETSHEVMDAAAVLDACGIEARAPAVKQMVAANISKYRSAFPPGAEESKVEKMERRFAWFRRLLKCYDDHLSGHIPAIWCVPQELCVEFCLATRTDVERQLQANTGTPAMEILIKIVQKTMEFEKTITNRMHQHQKDALRYYQGKDPQQVTQKWKTRMEGPPAETQPTPAVVKNYRYDGFITGCFDGFMEKYVQHENSKMDIAIKAHLEADFNGSLNFSEHGTDTLPSSLHIFKYVKDSLDRCLAFCKEDTLIKIHAVWSSNLIMYGSKLQEILKKEDLTAEASPKICIIVNTADWCKDNCSQLVTKMPECAEVKENEERTTEMFSSVMGDGVVAIVDILLKLITPFINEMTSMNWSAVDEVGDQSPYVVGMSEVIHTHFNDVLCAHLRPIVLRYLRDKFTITLAQRYIAAMYKIKRPEPSACQQLQINLQVLKNTCSKLPGEGTPNKKVIERSFSKGVGVLKFLSSQESASNGTVLAQCYEELISENDRSVADFVKLLEIKGIPTKEQKHLIDHLVHNNVPTTSTKETSQVADTDSKTVAVKQFLGKGWGKVKDFKGKLTD